MRILHALERELLYHRGTSIERVQYIDIGIRSGLAFEAALRARSWALRVRK